jgi:hypothetical protein
MSPIFIVNGPIGVMLTVGAMLTVTVKVKVVTVARVASVTITSNFQSPIVVEPVVMKSYVAELAPLICCKGPPGACDSHWYVYGGRPVVTDTDRVDV